MSYPNAKMFQGGGLTLDYTNPSSSAEVALGKLVKIAGLVGIAANAIPVSALGGLTVEGIAYIRKKDEAMPAGLPVKWDANANPKVGTAGTGAATTLLAAAQAADDLLLGSVVYAALAADEFVAVMLNQFNADYPAWPNHFHLADTTGTMDNTDCGVVHRIATVDQTLTMPEIATIVVGSKFIFINDCADGASLLTIAPHANDGFNGFGITHAVNKTLSNTKATSKRGDYLIVEACGDTHWTVLEMKGIWARQG